MKRRICLIIVGIILVAILAFAFYKLSAGDSFEKNAGFFRMVRSDVRGDDRGIYVS